ncbi:hypothetical protein SDC9_83928 [bioreactor metagenome]|uniref:Uncharacterized protein n=1 Tax=bioreactor metagenome TaxID=1076179 RepID=A0A644ZAJ8_9ZZZZ
MQFLKDLIRNLLILVVIGVVLYLLYPTMMGQVFQVYGSLFGPVAIILLVVFALPRKKRSRN